MTPPPPPFSSLEQEPGLFPGGGRVHVPDGQLTIHRTYATTNIQIPIQKFKEIRTFAPQDRFSTGIMNIQIQIQIPYSKLCSQDRFRALPEAMRRPSRLAPSART
jgi:hypothetical protein